MYSTTTQTAALGLEAVVEYRRPIKYNKFIWRLILWSEACRQVGFLESEQIQTIYSTRLSPLTLLQR